MVVLVDHRDGPRVQVEPEEVRPHSDAALESVTFLEFGELTVHCVCTH